jgi:hypothetical protein
MSSKTVTGALIATNGIVLYYDTGQIEILSQDNFKTKDILDQVMPFISRGEKAVIDLSEYSLADRFAKVAGDDVKIIERGTQGEFSIKTGDVEIKDGNRLAKHVDRIVTSGQGAKGFAKFMADFAKIKHPHSADDLLMFLENGDLPIADDGQIIAYKVLNVSDEKNGRFRDCHSNTIEQGVGSFVSVDADMVDMNRGQSCSTGLHICSRRYISGFYGYSRVITLVKVSAKDILTVPHGENTKVRGSGYHIVAVLPKNVGDALANGKTLDQLPEGMKILSAVVAGRHVGVLETVHQTKDKKVTTTKTTGKALEAALAQAQGEGDVQGVVLPPEVVGEQAKLAEAALKPSEARRMRDQMQAAATGDMAAALQNVGKTTAKLPWELAQVGDTVTVKGSKRIANGDYKVVSIFDNPDGSSRLRVDYKGQNVLVPNTSVQAIVTPFTKPKKKTLREEVKGIAGAEGGGAGKGPIEAVVGAISDAVKGSDTKAAEYAVKYARAKELLASGDYSLRDVEKELHIDGKRLSKKLKDEGFTYTVNKK